MHLCSAVQTLGGADIGLMHGYWGCSSRVVIVVVGGEPVEAMPPTAEAAGGTVATRCKLFHTGRSPGRCLVWDAVDRQKPGRARPIRGSAAVNENVDLAIITAVGLVLA